MRAVRPHHQRLEIVTVAGDPDALARVRLTTVAEVRDVIDRMGEGGRVIGTRTLMVLGRKRRGPGSRS